MYDSSVRPQTEYRGIMEESWRRNLWRRNHGGGSMEESLEEESWMWNYGRAMRTNHGGDIWGASVSPLGGIWETSGNHLGSISNSFGMHLGHIWRVGGRGGIWEGSRGQISEKCNTSPL